MYEIIMTTQWIGIIILFALIFHIWKKYNCKEQKYLLMAMICVMINLLGYTLEMTSKNIDVAILSNKVSYLGKCFLGWFMFMFIVKFCEYKFSKLLVQIFAVIHVLVFVLVFTCEYHSLYYTEIVFSTEVFSHLTTKNAPMYYVNMVLMGFYAVAIPVICFKTCIKMKQYKDRIDFFVLGCIGVMQCLGLLTYFTKIFEPYDTTYMSFVISIILLAILVYRYKTFDIVDYAKNSIVDSLNQPVIVFNKNLRVLYTNELAKERFPSLAENSEESLKLVKRYLTMNDENYISDGRYYETSLSEIYDRQRISGYILVFTDITEYVKENVELVKKVEKQNTDLEIIQKKIIISFANMIELRDDITGHHVKRTSEYVKILVTKLIEKGLYKEILTPKYAEETVQAAPLHDIGKIAIDDSILKKKGKLTDEEFDKIKEHPVIGAQMLDDILKEVESNEYLTIARNMAYYHHEKWDGTGYPLGISKDDIPLSARIMAIADVFDALTSKRTYKEAMSYDKAFEIIEESSGKHFDPKLVQAFLEAKDEVIRIIEE